MNIDMDLRLYGMLLAIATTSCQAAPAEPGPSAPAAAEVVSAGPMQTKEVAPNDVALGAEPVRVRLDDRSLAARLDAVRSGERLHVVVRGLHADAPPGVIFNLYLTGSHVGSLNFYAALPRNMGGGERFQSFDVTDAARALRARGEADAPVTLTIVPAAAPAPGSNPSIARIELVSASAD